MAAYRPGDTIVPIRACSVWHEDLDRELETLRLQDMLLVVQTGHKNRPKRLDPLLYVKVLTPRGTVGWVFSQNFSLCFKKTGSSDDLLMSAEVHKE